MIGYAMLGTNDLPKALSFYDELLKGLGAARMFGGEKFQIYGKDAPALGIGLPYDGKPATCGNGTMVALSAESQEQVRAVHEKALALGGKDEGAPGPRGESFYAAYFRDLDGNKLAVFKIG